MSDIRRKKYLRAKLLLSTLSLTCLFQAPTAFAQTTPTELANMSLEDLLSISLPTHGTQQNPSSSKWDFSYTYKKASFGGYKSGTRDLSFDDVLFTRGEEVRTDENYPVVPTYICQRVHAMAARYSVTNQISVNVSIPYIEQSSEHISSVPDFADFTLWSKGIGDIALSSSYRKSLTPDSDAQFNVGLHIPVGSIDVTGDTPRNGSGTLERLPYTMQLGSGTFDLTGSAQYTRRLGDIAVSTSAAAVVRTGKNNHDYRLGNSVTGSVAGRYTKHAIFKPGLRLTYRNIQSIQGLDKGLTINRAFRFPASITDPKNYGGESFTTSAYVRTCLKINCRISVDANYTAPIYQSLNGIQPKLRRNFSFGANMAF